MQLLKQHKLDHFGSLLLNSSSGPMQMEFSYIFLKALKKKKNRHVDIISLQICHFFLPLSGTRHNQPDKASRHHTSHNQRHSHQIFKISSYRGANLTEGTFIKKRHFPIPYLLPSITTL